MATPVIMPKFGMTQEEGTIIRWLRNEGDAVEKGDILLEVQTDKIDMDVEAPATGVLRGILYGAEKTVPVATVIAQIAAPGEELAVASAGPTAPDAAAVPVASPPSPFEAKATPVAQRVALATGIDLAQVQGSGSSGRITKADVEQVLAGEITGAEAETADRVRATPAARRLAREQQITLRDVKGTGPSGRVQAGDVAAQSEVAAAAESAISAPSARSETRVEPLRGIRRTIALRLTQSWQTIPHIFLSTRVDMSAADALRSELGPVVEADGARLTPTVLIAKAVATALTMHPRLNAWLHEEDGQLLLSEHDQVNLGIAVALDDGLIVPVVRGAEQLGLRKLAGQVRELSGKARAGQLAPDEVAGATFTISNLGMYPIDHFTAIINPPQVAILAVGRSQMQPTWDGAGFTPRPVVEVTLSADHRAVDGAMAAAFLAELKQLLEAPARMLL